MMRSLKRITAAVIVMVMAFALTSCAAILSRLPTDKITVLPTEIESVEVEPSEPRILHDAVSPGEILDYFNEVAIGSEYGKSADVLCKWTKKIRYAVEGSATEEDLALIAELCDRLNGIEGFPGIKKTSNAEKADFVVSFVSKENLKNMFDAAESGCAGMAEYSWDSATGEIISARVAIDEAITNERSSTICEEFLQALGPACDSYKYVDSVFYESTSFVPGPSELDWLVMEILYSPALEAGMTRNQALSAAATLVEWGDVTEDGGK